MNGALMVVPAGKRKGEACLGYGKRSGRRVGADAAEATGAAARETDDAADDDDVWNGAVFRKLFTSASTSGAADVLGLEQQDISTRLFPTSGRRVPAKSDR